LGKATDLPEFGGCPRTPETEAYGCRSVMDYVRNVNNNNILI
jgi:hypothetical protein